MINFKDFAIWKPGEVFYRNGVKRFLMIVQDLDNSYRMLDLGFGPDYHAVGTGYDFGVKTLKELKENFKREVTYLGNFWDVFHTDVK